MKRALELSVFILLFFSGCNESEERPPLQLERAFVGDLQLDLQANVTDGAPSDRSISLIFSAAVDETSAKDAFSLSHDSQAVTIEVNVSSDRKSVVIHPAGVLLSNTVYTLTISGALKGADGQIFAQRELRFKTSVGTITIVSIHADQIDFQTTARVVGVPLDLSVLMTFSAPVDPATVKDAIEITGEGAQDVVVTFSDENRTVEVHAAAPLKHLAKYQFALEPTLAGALGESFAGFTKTFYTEVDPMPKFPVIPDEELLTLVQQQTFKYFWDFAHPSSGMARERNTSGDVVTSGGSGFGIMALIVGMERAFISRDEGLERMATILDFLETADRFHGAWPHWLNGNTGDVIPFSANDNGGDLVETSFLVQGLLTFRQYLHANVPSEKALIDRINALWETVEWDWYTRDGQNVLYWHWSPDKQWAMNHPIRGYNEALITYFLAAASPTYPIDADVYHDGWAGGGSITNGGSFYNTVLPLGYDYGGPLFFAHYSFLGLDPRNLQDTYANYWTQNVNHSLINHAYVVDNPKNFVGYSDESWGLTASDSPGGYSAHSPTNDLGVITPTAALSSFPYVPEKSMDALRFFYYTLGDRLWGPYGFYDAFSITDSWTADSYLAIDQGPIIVMIENYRSGLLWDLFMSAPEVQVAMDNLGFSR